MKIGKIEAVLLAAIIVCGTMAFVLPAMAGNTALQHAIVYATGAVLIKDQNHSDDVIGWTFTGVTGENVMDPVNSEGETQNTTANEPVATLVNTNPVAVRITLNAGAWKPKGIVTSQGYNISATDNSSSYGGSFATLNLGSETVTGVTIGANSYRGLYLNATLGSAIIRVGVSTFVVTCEV